MRFLNTSTLHFEEVVDSELNLDKNQYAILSHRWGPDKDEVSYEEMVSSSSGDVHQKKGFAKIKGFCDLAASTGCRYAWVDTCCINKGNSSELAEAINSMYLWYSQSKICVVYLKDVPRKRLTESEWFDRGWTLQELIAPREVLFFDRDWKSIGTKTGLRAELARRTGIPEGVLGRTVQPSAYSVAQRMSWAAKRTTKRVEDRAYSLLGLFDVNMPMIYGEREKAFVRLQQQIVQKSKDESIFAWDMGPPDSAAMAYSGIYAKSPSAFVKSGRISQVPGSKGFSESNGELSIDLSVKWHNPGVSLALLHCKREGVPSRRICLVIAETSSENTYVRVRDAENISLRQTYETYWDSQSIQNLRFPVDAEEPPVRILYGFWLRTLQPPGWSESEVTILSSGRTNEAEYIHQLDPWQAASGIVRLNPKSDDPGSNDWSRITWIKVGFDGSLNPQLWLANSSQSPRLRDPFERALRAHNSGKRLAEAENDIMKGDLEMDIVCGDAHRHFVCDDLQHDWPHGRAIVWVNKKTGLRDFVIPSLGVRISLQLQPCYSPTVCSIGGAGESGSPREPMMVWVVDITSTTVTPKDNGVVCSRWLDAVVISPVWDWAFRFFFVLICGLGGGCNHNDQVDPYEECRRLCCCNARVAKMGVAKRRAEYKRNADSRIPVLGLGGERKGA